MRGQIKVFNIAGVKIHFLRDADLKVIFFNIKVASAFYRSGITIALTVMYLRYRKLWFKVSRFHADKMHMARLQDSSRRWVCGYSLEALSVGE